MKKYNYFPILKTTDSELKAYGQLPLEVQDGILPIFELTRSRRSKKNFNADIGKRVASIKELLTTRPFILDLTTEQSLSNSQIDEMLYVSKGGFPNWTSFVNEMIKDGLNVIPVIHYDPDRLADVRKQIAKLDSLSNYLAFRITLADNIEGYLDEVAKAVDISKLILIIDAGFIPLGAQDTGDKSANFEPILSLIKEKYSATPPKAIICTMSGFPSSVVKPNYGEYNNGSFPITEVATNKVLTQSFGTYHGDYGSVHPLRYETGWGWVPRIDFITKDRFCYYRYRPEDGGYITAAKRVINDSGYKRIKEYTVWGDSQISDAADGTPGGLNPAHWIAVRINIYISAQYLRLSKYPKLSL